MTTLTDILFFMNYKEIEEQIAYVQFLAYRGAFNQTDYYKYYEEKETKSLRYERRVKLVEQALPIWKQTQFKKYYEGHKGNVISKEEALELLKTKLHPSFLHSFIWFFNVVDIYFLRQSFEEECIDTKKIGINVQRWDQKDEIEISAFKEKEAKDIHAQLFQCAKSLHLIEETPWPTDQHYNHVILFSSVERHLLERIKFLPKFEGIVSLYFLTGARAAFNWETETTAQILAKWFNLPDKIGVIRHFLLEHQAKDDSWQWHANLSALKKGLMTRLGVKEWPKAPDSYYYYPGHKEIYDLVAKQAGRDYLDCEGGPWPVAPDLGNWILEERYKENPEILKKVNFIPIVAIGKSGRLANINDMLEKWLSHEGKAPIEEGRPVIMVGCNTTHFMPYGNYDFMHARFYQDATVRAYLQNKLNQFNEQKEEKINSLSFQTMTWKLVGPAAKTISISKVLDSLARAIYTFRQNIVNTLFHFKTVGENIFESQAPVVLNITLAKRMVCYHQQKEYLFLANAVVDLALSFYIQGDLIKTSGLFNFALNVLAKIKDEKVKRLIETLYKSTLVNMRHFTHMTIKKLSFPPKNIDIEILQSLDEKNKTSLSLIRQYVFKQFKEVSPGNSKAIFDLYHSISKKMQTFYLSLVSQAQALLGEEKEINNIMTILFMGSYSRDQETPISDIESSIIIGDDQHFELAKGLTKLILLKIFQLRETILPSLGIWVLDQSGKPFYLASKIFDDYGKDGFSFDRYVPLGCKTPLGKKDRNKVVYRLIGTPQFMASNLSLSYGFQLDPFIPQMIRLARYGCGNKFLYNQFHRLLSANRDANSSNYGLILLNQDLGKNICNLEEMKTLSVIQNKNYLYRPINVFLDTLLVALGATNNRHNCETIELLFKLGIIDYPQKQQLITILSYLLYLKLHQHLKYQEQKIYIKKTDPIFVDLNIVQQVMKSFLMDLSNFLGEKETLLFKKEYKMSVVYDFRMFTRFIKEISKSTNEIVYPIIPF